MDNSSAPARGDVVQHLLSRPHNSWLWDGGGVDLDTGQVRAFVAASESGSFGRAAAQLYMSQQALSKRIARLEASLGTLFTRSPGGVTLTARGARFLPDARDMVAMADAAVAGARGNRNGPCASTCGAICTRRTPWCRVSPPSTRNSWLRSACGATCRSR